nr:hypothetical protein [uncultured Rhodopila sp.]
MARDQDRLQHRMERVPTISEALVVGLMSALATSGAFAQIPGSPDPILRNFPIEPERFAPEPTPGLSIPQMTGRQIVVLRDYAGSINKQRAPLAPVVMYIPDGFFAHTSSAPSEVWGINLSVRYPEMRAFPPRARTCWGWCDGYMLLSVKLVSNTPVVSLVRELHDGIARETIADPLVAYTRLETPPDYNESYEQTKLKWKPQEVSRLYVKTDARGEAIEFVQCHPNDPSPGCEFIMMSGLHLEVDYSLSMDFWNQRDAVRAAVLQLVGSFISP